eukprot:m.49117 g.49117  ORF g.49117 m.49117 type:complete len:344 (+) comp12450_c1_seq1:259-1290(+)
MSRLHSTAWIGAVAELESLIDKGLDVNVLHPSTRVTPLHYAARRGNLEVVRILIAHGAFPMALSKDGVSPYDMARKHSQSDVADFLEKFSKCTLHLVSHERDINVVQEIIAKSENIDSRRYIGVTALHVACATGNTTVIRLLLSRGASTRYKDTRKRTCLHYAVLHGHKEAVALLLSSGMKTTSQDDIGKTAAEYARENYPEIWTVFENPPEKVSFTDSVPASPRLSSSAILPSQSMPSSPAQLKSPPETPGLLPPLHLTHLERMSQSSGSSISLLSAQSRDSEPEMCELKEFLLELDLVDKAYHTLIANEVSDVETLRLMSKQDMIAIGLKMGVALKIIGNL